MTAGALVALLTLIVVFVAMLAELRLSRANERALRARGAVEPRGDVYVAMAWAYPAGFLAMGVEGALAGPLPGAGTVAGAALLILSKGLKYWAVASLGPRWTFRVLVPPDAPLVTRGPYAYLNHPNYVAVIGEIVSVALLVGAPVSGVVTACGFGWLVRRRLTVEEQALGRSGGQAGSRGV